MVGARQRYGVGESGAGGGDTGELERQGWDWRRAGCSLVILVSKSAAGPHGSPGQLQPSSSSSSSCSPRCCSQQPQGWQGGGGVALAGLSRAPGWSAREGSTSGAIPRPCWRPQHVGPCWRPQNFPWCCSHRGAARAYRGTGLGVGRCHSAGSVPRTRTARSCPRERGVLVCKKGRDRLQVTPPS